MKSPCGLKYCLVRKYKILQPVKFQLSIICKSANSVCVTMRYTPLSPNYSVTPTAYSLTHNSSLSLLHYVSLCRKDQYNTLYSLPNLKKSYGTKYAITLSIYIS